jgi:transketolase
VSSPHTEQVVNSLARKAQELRIVALHEVYEAQSGHLGGSFSVAEILTALYFHQACLNPADPHDRSRDRVIVSKGHCAPIWYACLAFRGFFPVSELRTLRRIGSNLQGHPDPSKTPGVEVPSGPLGHGLSIGVGSALAARVDKARYRTYVVLGDGEIEAGIVWEAAMAAGHYGLSNLIGIVDQNGYQLDGSTASVMNIEPLGDKFRAFGWHVLEIDGHDMRQVLEALDAAGSLHGKPTMIIAHTVKGKGVSFMEYTHVWHGKAPDEKQYCAALAELEAHLAELKQAAPAEPPLEYPW